MNTVTLKDAATSLHCQPQEAFYALRRMGVRPMVDDAEFRQGTDYRYDRVSAGKAIGALLDKEAAVVKALWKADPGVDILSPDDIAAAHGVYGSDYEIEAALRGQGVEPISSPITLEPVRFIGSCWYDAVQIKALFSTKISLPDCQLWLGKSAENELAAAGIAGENGLYDRKTVMAAVFKECVKTVSPCRV